MHIFINLLYYICSGSLYYYTLTGSYWSHQSKISANGVTTVHSDLFGSSVSLYNNNTFIGSYNDNVIYNDSGTVYNNA